MISKKLLAGIVSVGVGLALSGQIASAQLIANDGDIFIGFRVTGTNAGASTDYLINVGSYTNYTTSTEPIVLSIGNIGTDLTNLYGPNWASDPNVSWGVVGVYQGSSLRPTLFSSQERTDLGTPATGYALLNNTNQSVVGGEIQGFQAYYVNSGSATPNSSVATLQSASANFSYADETSGSPDFGSSSNWTSIEGTFANGASGTALDLFQYSRPASPVAPLGAVTHLGTFTIASSGVTTSITFTGAAVPEPASLALVGLGGVFLLSRRQRRNTRSESLHR